MHLVSLELAQQHHAELRRRGVRRLDTDIRSARRRTAHELRRLARTVDGH